MDGLSAFKDWLILAILFALVLCVIQLRKLRKSIPREIQKRIIPPLGLELNIGRDEDDTGLFLRNDGYSAVRNVVIEDLPLTLDDWGLKVSCVVRFKNIDTVGPQQRVKVPYRVYDKHEEFLPQVTDKLLPHLIGPDFKVKIRYTTIEGATFSVIFSKQRDKFSPERIVSF